MSPRPGLNLGVWRTELVDDADQEFVLSGLKYGFNIVDNDVQVVPVEVEKLSMKYLREITLCVTVSQIL